MPSIRMKRLAIVIGIDEYPAPQRPLEGCVGDAQRFGRFLSSARGGSFEVVVPVLNHAANLGALREIFQRVSTRSWDQVVVYFSGHGADSGILAWDRLMRFEELASWIRSIQANWHLLILDACQAGAVHEHLDGIGGVPAPYDSVSIYLELLQQAHPGLRVLTAVDRYTYAEERAGQGLFTTALLRAARIARPDLPHKGVSAERLLSVATWILRDNGAPLPQGSGYLSDLPVGLTDAFDPLGGAAFQQAPPQLKASYGSPLSASFGSTVRIIGRRWMPTFVLHQLHDGATSIDVQRSARLLPKTNDVTVSFTSQVPLGKFPPGRPYRSVVTVLDELDRPVGQHWVDCPPFRSAIPRKARVVGVLPRW